MAFTMIHENYNVSNLDVSISFYEKASTWPTTPKPLNWS